MKGVSHITSRKRLRFVRVGVLRSPEDKPARGAGKIIYNAVFVEREGGGKGGAGKGGGGVSHGYQGVHVDRD